MNHSIRERGRTKALKPFTAAAALASLAIVAAACGSSGGSSSNTTAAAPATTAAAPGTTAAASPGTTAAPAPGTTAGGAGGAATGTPVKIALLSDETGVSPSKSAGAVKAAADYINANGGLNGHPIEIDAQDTKSDTAAAQAAVAKIPKDVVAVILGLPTSEASISPALSALNVPILGVGYNPGVWGGNISVLGISCAKTKDFCAKPNFFTTATTSEAVIADQLVAAKNVGAKKVVSAVCAEVDSCSTSVPVFKAIGEQLGLQVAPAVKISSNAPDYSAQCVGFIQDGIDFVQISAGSATGVNLIKSCQDQGYKGTFGASAGSVAKEILAAPGQLAGGLNGFPWFVDDAAAAQYRKTMEAAGISKEDYGNPVFTGQYSNMLLLQKEINEHADKSAPLTGAAALAAMYQTKDENLGGMLAQKFTFTKDNLDRAVKCFWPYIKKADGTLTQPAGGLNVQCFPES